ncbi:MAG: competence/damage-inducible protein A [Dehalococcoidia bacterium]|nr:competence/damage-inducible protein A [Dehalococcoidia bacterium]
MKAEILSIGTEILLGEITDTNAAYLAGQLPLLGIDLYRVTQVGDNQTRIVEALHQAWDRSDLIIATGGLGPTEDDLTREAIAEMLHQEMAVDPALEDWLKGVFHRLGREMPARNLKQATLIPSARAIPNPTGTAPGWWVRQGSKMILAMPGPPGEMKQMWEKEIKPELQKLSSAIICSQTLKIWGLGESKVDEMISPLLSSTNPTIGVYAKLTGIEVRVTAKASSRKEAEKMIVPLEKKIRSILGDHIWGTGDEILEKMVGDLLRRRGLTLATMESCTGGLLANLITDVPGSSDYFKGGLVAYSNEAKVAFGVDRQLIIRYGAVSSNVAEAMAVAAKTRLGASIGIGTTGVAGPDELEGKPVGTVYIGITDGEITRSIHVAFPQHRPRIKRYAAMGALFALRRLLLEKTHN